MLTLIQNAEVYAPKPLGRCDVLVAGGQILALGPDGIDLAGSPLQITDAGGRWLLPGFVDALTHPCGGGGEGGFGNRTPELEAVDFIRAGVTSPVGALGTDSIVRSLEVLYGKVMELRARGLSACMYSGSYRVPPLTLTGDLARDMVLIDPVIGVGEVAISDHRSSQPTIGELRRLAADVHLGGTLSGKRGVVFLHLGDGQSGLGPIEDVLQGSELPRRLFYPTHINRNPDLLEQAIAYVKRGAFADITVSTTDELVQAGDTPALVALRAALEAGAPAERLTLSSDAGGSLPLYQKGELVGLKSALPLAMLETLQTAMRDEPDLVEPAIAALSANPAAALGLGQKGRIAEGLDADLLLIEPDSGDLTDVMSRGRWLLREGSLQAP